MYPDFPLTSIRVMIFLTVLNFENFLFFDLFYIYQIISSSCWFMSNFPPQERDGVTIPCFLKDHLIPLTRAGQQLQVLMKLLELCTYVASNEHSYEDLLPHWNAFSSNHLPNACPITFKKENIETRVISRGSYYKMMLEKLESLLTKLEFRYQQVITM